MKRKNCLCRRICGRTEGVKKMEKLKVLVVDDESRMRKLVRDFLVKQDYEVVEAEDGENAFN